MVFNMKKELKKNIRKLCGVFFLFILDIIAYYLSLFLASTTRNFINFVFPKKIPLHIFSFEYYSSILWIPAVIIMVFIFERLYTKRVPFWEEEKSILKSISLAMLFVFFFLVIRGVTATISRLTMLFLWFYAIFVFSILRYFGKKLLFNLKIWKENVIIIGIDEKAINIAKSFIKQKELGYNVVGFLSDDHESKSSIQVLEKNLKILGNIKKAKYILNKFNVNVAVISLENYDYPFISDIAKSLQRYVDTVMIRPVFSEIAQLNTELHYMFFEKILLIKINNNLRSIFNKFIKFCFDYAVAIMVLPFFLVLIGVISLIIKLTSKGPVFIFQDRIGEKGKIFKCIKFRTMYENSNEILKEYLSKNREAALEWKEYKKLKKFDPRVTKIGRFLRRTSLDELPQIFNVLKGEMSIVGPRPYLLEERKEMEEFLNIILLAKPGITGLWQVSGRNDFKFKERMELEAWYVENWSIWLDIIILLKTFLVILKSNGGY